MNRPPANERSSRERSWRTAFFGLSAVTAAFALVDVDAGRWAGAAGNAGVCCLMLSLMHQFPVVKALVGAATKRASAAELQRESEKLHRAKPWTDRLAGVGWTLLLTSLVLHAFGID